MPSSRHPLPASTPDQAGLSLGEIVYDGGPDGLSDELLREIYGAPTGAEAKTETPRFVEAG